jgi:hypothetical protein
MSASPERPHMHFHIHWEGSKNLDWECFESQSDALGRALEIARPEEDFTIEEVCPLRRSRSASASQF